MRYPNTTAAYGDDSTRTSTNTTVAPEAALCTSIIIVILSSIMLLFYHKTKPKNLPKSLPGPPRQPYTGILFWALKNWDDWPNAITQQLKKFNNQTFGGPLPNFGGLSGGVVFISSQDNIKDVLKTNFESYIKGDVWQKNLGELLGKGIFTVDGQQWKVHRKLMSRMFSNHLLRQTGLVMRDKLNQVIDQFHNQIKEKTTVDEEQIEIDMQDMFYRILFDTISQFALGESIDTVQNEQQPFNRAFDELASLCHGRFTDPLFGIKKRFNLTYEERRIKEMQRVVDDYAYGVIKKRRKSWKNDNDRQEGYHDLLTLFIEYSEKHGEDISDEELRDVVMNVLIAGRDTTACALSWTWYELTRHPEVVSKIISEVKEICYKNDGKDPDFSFDTMNQLKYTHCVALETLRLHPSVTNDPKYAKVDTTLPDGTKVPAGLGIDMCFYAMGRREDIWGEDVLEFRPERFYDKKEPSPFMYPVFSAGPRMCLGRPLALMNMKLAMSMLLTSFDFIDEKGHDGTYNFSMVLAMKNGLPLVVRKKVE